MPIRYNPHTGTDVHALFKQGKSYSEIADKYTQEGYKMSKSLAYKKHQQFLKWAQRPVNEAKKNP